MLLEILRYTGVIIACLLIAYGPVWLDILIAAIAGIMVTKVLIEMIKYGLKKAQKMGFSFKFPTRKEECE